MDNQWQHQYHHQPIQGNTFCPTCSISHFPFCPPHPSFNPSPRFPSPHQTHHFHAPNFNQYGLHPAPYNPNDLYQNPGLIALHKNPNSDSDSSHEFGYGSNHGFGGGDDRNIKRVKVDDFGSSKRVISEADERRLKLIREHGGSISGPPQIEGNLSKGFREIGNYNDLGRNIGENAFKSPVNSGSSFQDPGFGSIESKRKFLQTENVPNPHIFREEHNPGFRNQYMGQFHMPGDHNEISSNTPSASNNEQRNNISMENLAYNGQQVGSHSLRDSIHKEYDFRSPSILNDTRHLSEVRTPLREGNQFPLNDTNQGKYLPIHMASENLNQMHASQLISAPPPLPPSPPPPPPIDSPTNSLSELNAAYKPHLSQPYFQNNAQMPVSIGYLPEEARGIRQTSSQHYIGQGRIFPIMHMSADKQRMIDAFHLFKLPDRVSRPHHIVIILRGLPGSGKSYLAKMIRDLEVENGGDAPRIHSMDDYFMSEVEKVDESEMAKSTSSGRGKKPSTKVVMEYCYEPEMEEAYRSSMLKAFKKTIEEGGFTFIIVDDRNLRVADFAQFWAIAKRSGFEVYLSEATYKDPAGCAARNVHGFTQDDIRKMAKQWEEAPSWYLQLDIKSLFHGDDLKDGGIEEVDMDTGERDIDEDLSETQVEKRDELIELSATGDHATGISSLKDEKRWDGEVAEGGHPAEQVKELGRSKWSDDFDEDDGTQTKGTNGNLNSLSGLIQSYGKDGKSVHWGDQAGNTGFSIGAAKKTKEFSLVIGPGSGYNLKSNPLPDVNITTTTNTGDKRNIFEQQLRAERESSKAIFDRRRHKIGLDVDEE